MFYKLTCKGQKEGIPPQPQTLIVVFTFQQTLLIIIFLLGGRGLTSSGPSFILLRKLR